MAGALAACLVALLAIGALWMLGLVGNRTDRLAPLTARVNDLDRQVKQTAPTPQPDARIPALAARVTAAEQMLTSVTAFEARLAKAEAAGASTPAPADPALAERMAAADLAAKSLAEGLAELRKRVDENSGAAREARDTAMQSSGAANAAAAGMAGDMQNVSARIATLEGGLKALQETLAKTPPPDVDRAARLASTALALRSAVERGDPYEAELAAVRPLVSDAATLVPLEPFAASGIPSSAALAAELLALTAAPRAAAEPETTGSGMLDRLKEGAGKLVKIRPATDTAHAEPGSPIGRPLARVQTLAARGDLAGANAELAKLPAQDRATTDSWLKRSEAREAAIARARQLARDSLAALGKS